MVGCTASKEATDRPVQQDNNKGAYYKESVKRSQNLIKTMKSSFNLCV